ncbi:IQ motif and SEC7 domain-containing protein 1-like [Orbicella faveolata]|uniref:IQ motif and SEC7 domain-containing protein 1-like n=1 Tax=Orbicella faveolata TaxID=48498 RepID=UPI0009E313BC|nr:IQ motif and SEC7 domain-containing protein 1-like [Orbicella faveolata]
MQDFAEQYVECNPSDEKGVVDTILILAFAIVMLNTDLHSPNVKRRMTEIDFMNNLKGTNNGGDFPKESLLGIYNRIKKVPLIIWLVSLQFAAKADQDIFYTVFHS